MSNKTIRSYPDILAKIKSSIDDAGRWVRLGEVSNLATSHFIEKIVLNEGGSKRVLISAGIHGDEPAGVATIHSFLKKKDYQKYSKEWEITLVPCINPFGYEANIRENHDGVDLNRKFNSSAPPKEVIFAQKLFDSPFDLTIELHEDIDSSGYYLFYSRASGGPPLPVSEILKNVQTIMPINLDSEIDEIQAKEGVIARVGIDNTMDWWPMAFYSLSKGTQACLTLETGTQFSIETRVSAHLIAIKTALDLFVRKTKEQ